MADEFEQKTPRRAETGSYQRRTSEHGVTGRYQSARHTSSRTRQISLDEIKAGSRSHSAPHSTVLSSEKERFDFKELFSKKNMRRFNRHLFFYLLLVTIALLISWLVIVAANDINAFIKEDETIVVSIPKGAGSSSISKVLEQNNVIDSGFTFKVYCKLKKSGGFQSGEYELNSNMCYKEIIKALQQPSEMRETVKITIPEGYEQKDIIDLLVSKKYADRATLENVIANYDFNYDFIRDLPKRNNRLEGYLFPDTYSIYVGDEVSIINTMLSNFEKKINDKEIQSKLKKSDYTLDEIITMASIIQREGASENEFGKVSSVFYNRLNSTTYPYLESCATVQYVLTERKSVLSIADTKMDNPYNTYQNKGLPPGPISCPGLAAVKAALEPEQTDYYFFVANGENSLFAKTYQEHIRNVKRAGNGSTGTSTVN